MEFNFISFVLGISVVLVAGGLTVGVIGFFKAIGLKKKVDENHKQVYVDFDKQSQNLWTHIETNRQVASKDLQTYNQGIYSDFDALKRELDSRLDKLDNKIKTTGVKPIKEG